MVTRTEVRNSKVGFSSFPGVARSSWISEGGQHFNMGTLKEKADIIKRELGLEPGLPIADIINQACVQLGLVDEVGSLTLVQRADACISTLTGSAAPIPVLTGSAAPIPVGKIVEAVAVAPSYGMAVGGASPLAPPSPEQMQRSGDVISAQRLGGCWIGSVLGVLPWAASLEPQGPDVYTRNLQCCMLIPINCGNRYVRVGNTSTFRATDDDIETMSSESCSSFSPTPGCGVRISDATSC